VSERGASEPRGEWAVRQPEGYYDAMQAMGTMVAPILAGFAFAILALVLVPPAKGAVDPVRWRDPVLALLVFSALSLIICIQGAIRARATFVKPDELRAWYPTSVNEQGEPNKWLADRQKALEERTARASTASRHTYNAGTLLFFTAIAVLLVPPSPVDDARRVTLVAATLAVAVEAAWLTGTSLRQHHWTQRLPTLLTPVSYAVGAVVILGISSTGASRAAAAASIAIAGAAALAAAIRLTFARGGSPFRTLGLVLMAATAGAVAAAVLLLAGQGTAAAVTDITAVALFVPLLITALDPSAPVKGPDDD
jgi:hypothetical protein